MKHFIESSRATIRNKLLKLTPVFSVMRRSYDPDAIIRTLGLKDAAFREIIFTVSAYHYISVPKVGADRTEKVFAEVLADLGILNRRPENHDSQYLVYDINPASSIINRTPVIDVEAKVISVGKKTWWKLW